MKPIVILIVGLPSSGKTTLAKGIVPLLNAVHWNADEIRDNVNDDLGFSIEDRMTQARRMGWLSRKVRDCGVCAVCDFVCPTPEARDNFGKYDVLIWMDTIKPEESPYPDTAELFVGPELADLIFEEKQLDTNLEVVLDYLSEKFG